jgi:hypothetical protein
LWHGKQPALKKQIQCVTSIFPTLSVVPVTSFSIILNHSSGTQKCPKSYNSSLTASWRKAILRNASATFWREDSSVVANERPVMQIARRFSGFKVRMNCQIRQAVKCCRWILAWPNIHEHDSLEVGDLLWILIRNTVKFQILGSKPYFIPITPRDH